MRVPRFARRPEQETAIADRYLIVTRSRFLEHRVIVEVLMAVGVMRRRLRRKSRENSRNGTAGENDSRPEGGLPILTCAEQESGALLWVQDAKAGGRLPTDREFFMEDL